MSSQPHGLEPIDCDQFANERVLDSFQLCVLGPRVHRGQVEPQHQDRPEEGDGGAQTRRLVSRNPCQICQDFHSGVETFRCLRNAKRVKN